MGSTESGSIFSFREDHGPAEKGFALIATLMAMWILAALGVLVFTVTTQDVRVSSKTVGEKKAFLTAESGIGWTLQNFNPGNLPATAVSNKAVDASRPTLTDPKSVFDVSTPASPKSGPASLPSPGFAIGGGEVWGQVRYVSVVTGKNTSYNTTIPIEVGIGYGPVDITTIYR
jgi:Tfp pilus assembly protein PilX